MIRVRNTKTGVVVAGYLDLLKRTLNVDTLEVLDGDQVLDNEDVRAVIDNFKAPRAPRPAKPQPVEDESSETDESGEKDEEGEGSESTEGTTIVEQILAAKSKDELETIVRENLGVDLDKRRGMDKLRAEALTLAQE